MPDSTESALWRPRLLVVEDDPDLSRLLEHMVSLMEYEHTFASTIAEAKAAFEAGSFDLLILDYRLPDGTGADMLRWLRAGGYATLVLCISAEDPVEVLPELFAIGRADFLAKPFQMIEFHLKLGNLLEMARLLSEAAVREKEAAERQARLRRYLSADVADKLMDGTIGAEIGGKTSIATILMLDIRDSTLIAERMPPDQVAVFLTETLGDAADLIYGRRGTIASFTGDGLLAVFGEKDGAMHGVSTALSIRKYLEQYNQLNVHDLPEPLKIGMGIATGPAFQGTIGSIHRLDYTVIGDPVNLASRLQSLSKLAGVDILIDGPTFDGLNGRGTVRRVRVDRVRGRKEKVDVYYVVGLND